MKKILLIALTVCLGTPTFAQNKASKEIKHATLRRSCLKNALPVSSITNIDERKGGPVSQNSSNVSLRSASNPNSINSITDDFIGATYYDNQTNASISNRFLRHTDGTMSAVWTSSCGNAATDRGTGYNYWNGSAWTIPNTSGSPNCQRIESIRVGFTNIVVTSSGHELAVAHTANHLNVCTRPAKGTGTWTDTTPFGTTNTDTWSKGIAGGASGQSIHVLVHGTGTSTVPINGQLGPLFYFRSQDDGATFPVSHQTFTGLDSTDNIGINSDAYSIDSRGDVIAIAVGNFKTNLYLFKSTDDGSTWNRTTIFQSPLTQPWVDSITPYPDLNGDGGSDSLELPSGDLHVMIDNSNNCHVWWSTMYCYNQGAGTFYFPNALDGLYYWHEGMAANSATIIAVAPDMNADGMISIPAGGLGGGNGMGTYGGSAVTQMPTSGIDAAGNLYLAYQSYNETTDTTIFTGTGHKHIYVIKSTDGGATWTDPNRAFDILMDSDSSLEEGVYACMAKYVDNDVYVLYQRDYAPGNSLSTNTTQAGWNAGLPSDIIVGHFPASDIPTGINNPSIVHYDFSLGQNQPNPAHDFTIINFTLIKRSSVKLEISDVIGKLIYSESQDNLANGNHQVTVNTAGINAGVYFYSLSVNGQKITRKLIVE